MPVNLFRDVFNVIARHLPIACTSAEKMRSTLPAGNQALFAQASLLNLDVASGAVLTQRRQEAQRSPKCVGASARAEAATSASGTPCDSSQ